MASRPWSEIEAERLNAIEKWEREIWQWANHPSPDNGSVLGHFQDRHAQPDDGRGE